MYNTRRFGKNPLTYVPELIRFEKENRRRLREESSTMANNENQADTRVLLDTSMLGLGGIRQSITRPNVKANTFKIKPALL